MNKTRLAELAPTDSSTADGRNPAVDHLRAFVTLLVLTHHSVIAYVSLAPPPGPFARPPYLWGAFPVVDDHRWAGWTALVVFDDMYFMALMFFISGLFVMASLTRKGPAGFLRDRLTRLGPPFLAMAALLAPLAYYPPYLLAGGTPDPVAYGRAWLALPEWNSGPAWFLGVLMALAAVVTAIQALAPRALPGLARLARGADRRPGRAFLGLSAASALAYFLALLAFDALDWLHAGPFAIQASRIGHYPLYFFAGVAVGAAGLDQGLLAPKGELARRWKLWSLGAVAALATAAAVIAGAYGAKGHDLVAWKAAGAAAFALTCAASCFALMAIFRRFANRSGAAWDSLSANAYGMYVIHYPIASWIQLALLPADLPGAAKGLIVAVTVIGLSWGGTAVLRRIPGVGRIL